MRLFAACGRHRPDRSVIAFFLFVRRHAHKRDPRSIRRNLRVADPDKIPEIFFGNVAFLGESDACAKGKQNDEAAQTSSCCPRFNWLIRGEARMTNAEGMPKPKA